MPRASDLTTILRICESDSQILVSEVDVKPDLWDLRVRYKIQGEPDTLVQVLAHVLCRNMQKRIGLVGCRSLSSYPLFPTSSKCGRWQFSIYQDTVDMLVAAAAPPHPPPPNPRPAPSENFCDNDADGHPKVNKGNKSKGRLRSGLNGRMPWLRSFSASATRTQQLYP